MRFAVDIPNFGSFGSQGNDFSDPHFVAELAYEAEQAGWDGFFIWDHIGADWPVPIADPWMLLAAVALRTTAIKLGPMITPLPRRRPWKLARETATLDQLARGRLILGVGIGDGPEYTCFGEVGNDRIHGEMLDEGLMVLQGLWSGEPFSYAGTHYQITNAHFLPKPLQTHIPIWVAGIWPNKKPLRRAAHWNGIFPLERGLTFTQQMSPERMHEVRAYVQEHQPNGNDGATFDVVHWGITTGEDPAADRALVESYQAVGVTWWLENFNDERGSIAAQRARIRKGPPRLD